jgi:hypothetical protein
MYYSTRHSNWWLFTKDHPVTLTDRTAYMVEVHRLYENYPMVGVHTEDIQSRQNKIAAFFGNKVLYFANSFVNSTKKLWCCLYVDGSIDFAMLEYNPEKHNLYVFLNYQEVMEGADYTENIEYAMNWLQEVAPPVISELRIKNNIFGDFQRQLIIHGFHPILLDHSVMIFQHRHKILLLVYGHNVIIQGYEGVTMQDVLDNKVGSHWQLNYTLKVFECNASHVVAKTKKWFDR